MPAKPPGRHAAPTLVTVAQRAGVSRQTVSNALNNPGLLRPETLARVQVVIQELGYSPNQAARQLRSGSSHLIGLRFDPQADAGVSVLLDRFLHSLVRAAAETGNHVLLFSGDPEQRLDGYDAVLRSTGVDAFIVTDTYAGIPQAALLQDRGVPFVTFGRPWDDPGADHAWVDVDGAAGAASATRHLREMGHQTIAWLGWEETSRIGEDRRAGWAAHSDGPARRLADDAGAARLAAHELLEDPSVTGFACVSDTIAYGVLHACAERGLRVGADIGVTGFDDSPGARVAWPTLTSVRAPLEEVAVRLIEVLALVLDDEPFGDRGRMLAPSLVVRDSSRR